MSQVTTTRRRALRPRGKLLQEDARRHHRALLLQQLFRGGPASRADLARSTDLTRVTVSDLVAELIAEGLLAELGVPAETRVGKPPTLVGIEADATHIVAIDLSPSDELAGAVVNLAGTVVARKSLARKDKRGKSAVTLVHKLVTQLMALTDRPILGIGVASPGIVADDGTVLDAPNMGWRDVALAEGLREAFGVPAYVANDANTAVLGEHTFGGAGDGGLMLLRVGTGVGAGLVIEGALLHGHTSSAGEIGHVTVEGATEQCACGRVGCLETLVAVPRLRARLAAAKKPTKVLEDVGKKLGGVLAPVVGTLNLHELVLSGPADLFDGPLRESAAEAIRARTMPVSSDGFVIRTSVLGDEVTLVGAAVLVLAAELGVA